MKPKRGELYRLKSDRVGKPRIIVIVSHDILNGGHCVLAVPFYSQQMDKRRHQQWCSEFARGEGGLDCDCVAKADELSLIDKLDINLAQGPIGAFDNAQMSRVKRRHQMVAVHNVVALWQAARKRVTPASLPVRTAIRLVAPFAECPSLPTIPSA